MAALRPRILCTEDDPDTRDLITIFLTHDGFEAIWAENQTQAIELARSQQFSLFLLDTRMPGFSGVELCQIIRKFDLTTPILFYSAAAYQADIENARLAGAQGYLVKPAGGGELTAEVSRLIAESKRTDPAPISKARSSSMSSN
jgi:DNA-binding response OmpR family regulator